MKRGRSSRQKQLLVVVGLGLLAGAALLKFSRQPTYENGLQAAYAVAQALLRMG